jgi:hypothetical protein
MAEETFDPGGTLSIVPPLDEDLISADDALASAEASLTDDINAPGAAPPPIPFGKSWAWDRRNERYVRAGTAPLQVTGYDALREWIYSALQTAQGVHPVFSDQFGIEDPEDWIGLADPSDAMATFEPRAREALLQHERIEDVDEMDIAFDPDTGTITVSNIIIITDASEAVPLSDIEITPNI